MRLYLSSVVLIIFGLLNQMAWATCAADGSITGSNGPLVLGSGGCAAFSTIANIDAAASVINLSGDALTAPTTDWNITNNGVISASGSGISMQNGGSITNSAGASITSSGGNAISSFGGGVPQITLENFGTISTTGDSGALLLGGATVINHVGGLIQGGFDGLLISSDGPNPSGGPSFVDNAGSIISAGGFNDGVLLGLGGSLINRVTGIITGFLSVGTQTNNSTVENFGQIGDESITSTAVGLGAGGTVTNHAGGQIIGPSRGISVDGGVGSIMNEGSIVASGARAISMSAGGTVSNIVGGIISGGSRGIFINGAPGTVENAGTIIGNTAAGGYPAIEMDNPSSSVSNTGTINGDVAFDTGSSDSFLMTAGQMIGQLQMGTGGNETAVFENVNDINNIGSITFFNGGGGGQDVLTFNNTQHTGGSEMTNWETINVINGSTLTLASNLTLGGVSADTTATLNIQSAAPATLVAMNGSNAVIAALQGSALVNNAGIINLSSSTATNTLTIRGNYVGQNGVLILNTVLAGDNASSDMLIIDGQNGNANASGNTQISIQNLGGAGVQTVANGIVVVEAINNATTNADAFTLSGPVRVGAYDYNLFRGGLLDSVSLNPAGLGSAGLDPTNSWFLRSTFSPNSNPIIGPEISVYGSVLPTAMGLGFITVGTLHERVGNEGHLLSINSENLSDVYLNGAWIRVLDQNNHADYSSVAQPSVSGNITGIQAGLDVYRNTTTSGQLNIAGLYFAYIDNNPSVNGIVTNADATTYMRETTGSLNLRANTLGVYSTHYWPSKAYLDLVAQASFYGGGANSFRTSIPTTGQGMTGSAELGYPFHLSKQWNLEPQAQIAYQYLHFQNTSDSFSTINLGSNNVLLGRIGARAEYQAMTLLPFLRANLWSTLAGGQSTTTYGNIDAIPTQATVTWTQLGGGFTWSLNKGVHLYAFADALLGINHNHQNLHGVDAGLGIRANW